MTCANTTALRWPFHAPRENFARAVTRNALRMSAFEIAEHQAVGVLREKRQNAGLAPTAPRQIARLHEGVLAEVRHGMEIEIKRVAGEQRFADEFVVPGGEQKRDFIGRDPRRVLGEEALLGHRIEAAEEPHSATTQTLALW